MEEHPGRLGSQRNPRANEESDEGFSDEDIGMSETSSEFRERREEEEQEEVTRYITDMIEVVNTATTRLRTLVDDEQSKRPIGGLRGRWELYNLEVCPKTFEPTGEYFRLIVSKEAAEGQLPVRDRRRYSPFESFIQWSIKEEDGGIVPFRFPTKASLEPVPIRLSTGASDDVPAEIIFLGNDCLWFRVPRSIVYPDESGRGRRSLSMIEFAGIRETEADIEERKRKRNRPSPRNSFAASLCGWEEC